MTSKERYIAESLLQQAERDFQAARQDVRIAALSYERSRDWSPSHSRTGRARSAWNINVIDWIAKAVAFEEALEKVVRLDSDAGSATAASELRPVDLSTVDGEADTSKDKALRVPNRPPDQLDAALQDRLNKTRKSFSAAAEEVRQARSVADQAYVVYRRQRATASQGQLDELREQWRQALVRWSQALGLRETAREKALAAVLRANRSSTEPEALGSVLDNIGDYDPEEDQLW